MVCVISMAHTKHISCCMQLKKENEKVKVEMTQKSKNKKEMTRF